MLKKSLTNYDVDRPKGKNKKVRGLMKDELGGGIITEFVTMRPNTYSYMTDEFIEMKKSIQNCRWFWIRKIKCIIEFNITISQALTKYIFMQRIDMKKISIFN